MLRSRLPCPPPSRFASNQVLQWRTRAQGGCRRGRNRRRPESLAPGAATCTHEIGRPSTVRERRENGTDDKKTAQKISKELGKAVEYAPFWVRMLSALCLGIGTMFGYKRIVTTLGERLGNIHLTPAQGASAEVVSAVLIGTAGFTGLPV